MKKKVLSLVMAAAMVLSLAGCGDNASNTNGGGGSGAGSSTTKKKNEEPITITVFSELANYSGIQGGWSAALLEDKFNVKLNIIPEAEGTYETRVEAGNLGDIVVWGSDGANYQNAVNLGLLYDWEEDDLLKEYGPYINEHMKAALENNRKISGDETKIYGFGHSVAPSADSHSAFFYTWDIRWDLYKQLGYPKVNNMDDLLNVLVKMKEICPTDEAGEPTYALSMWPDWDGDMCMYVKCIATTYYGYDGDLGLGHYDAKTGDFYGALDDNSPYLQMLEWTNRLYRAGLIDPDSMSQTYNDMAEKLANGGVFFSVFNYAGRSGYNTLDHLNEGKMMFSLCPTEAHTPVAGMNPYGGSRIWSIGANTMYPELCMEIINWLATPDGAMTTWYGPRGLTWDYDEEGWIYLTELGEKTNADSNYDMAGVTYVSPETGKEYALSGTFNDGCIQINNVTWDNAAVNLDSKHGETYDKDTWKTQLEKNFTSIQQDWVNYTGCNTTQEYFEKTDYYLQPATRGYVSPEKSPELETVWSQVTDCLTQYSWNAIYAQSEAEFKYIVKEMIKKCNAYGYDQCLAWSKEAAKAKFASQIQ
ncbi:MAG: extracellular solute-binding protein [Lachnospiraceae bacterium]|nr:extracellular solute-binding protein [Lachnospiraceae bacterium]